MLIIPAFLVIFSSCEESGTSDISKNYAQVIADGVVDSFPVSVGMIYGDDYITITLSDEDSNRIILLTSHNREPGKYKIPSEFEVSYKDEDKKNNYSFLNGSVEIISVTPYHIAGIMKANADMLPVSRKADSTQNVNITAYFNR